MADVTLRPSTWCSISLAAGPTINVFDYDFHTRTDWFLDGRRFATGRRVESGSEVKAGARVLGLITCNLNREGTFFIELGGGYDWVDSFTVKSGGGANVEIDASSWTTRGGLGFRF
jgi:hypothetical protein